jgi:zinc/manganese transport system ATP-binding protein
MTIVIEKAQVDARPAARAGTADGTRERDVAVAFHGAEMRLGDRTIWSDVDVHIASGEFVAVLGPNGAGKSTLLKAILGLLPLRRGSVTVLGHPARRGDARIGYLPQRRSFDPDLRVRGRDLVQLGLDGNRWGTPLPFVARRRRAADSRRVDEVIDLVGATGYAGRPLGELSGGEQQRLLIAHALVPRPRLLLLDEPLDSLDITNQQQVAALVQHICRDQHVAVLLVAHDVNVILPYLDRVVYVAGGHALIGAPSEVITTESLTRLYGARVEVLRASDGRLVVVGQPEDHHAPVP